MRKGLHLLLFVATCASVFWAGLSNFNAGAVGALQFAAGLMAILTAHEAGHWLLARHHGVEATLPYFIPVPFGFGTMGAVIRLQERVPRKDVLVDIGAAGPLAGFAVAVPLLFLGAWLSRVGPVPVDFDVKAWPPPTSLVGLVSMAFDAPPILSGVEVFGDNLLTLLATWLTKGTVPPGHEVYAHPLFIAAWFGLFVTMLNLLPMGQFDGGHLTYALLGAKGARRLGWGVRGLLLGLGIFASVSWLVWLLVSRFAGLAHPPVEEEQVPLSAGRRLVCWVAFLCAVLCFMPVPLSVQ